MQLLDIRKCCCYFIPRTNLLAFLTDQITSNALQQMHWINKKKPYTVVVKRMRGRGLKITWTIEQLTVLLVDLVVVCYGPDYTSTCIFNSSSCLLHPFYLVRCCQFWIGVKDIIELGLLWRDSIMIPRIEVALQYGSFAAILLKTPLEYATVGRNFNFINQENIFFCCGVQTGKGFLQYLIHVLELAFVWQHQIFS